MTNDRHERTENRRPKPEGRHLPPGRIRGDDSIDASSEDTDRTDDGHRYSAGYESQMATRIGDENEYDPDVEQLRALHEGRHQSDGEHSLRESQRDKRRISQALCSSLPISDHEREQVVAVVESFDLDRFGNQKAIPRVTLGVVAVVVDERMRDGAGDDREIVAWTDEFRACCEDLDVSMSDLSTIKEIVREAIGERALPMGGRAGNRDPNLPGLTDVADRPAEYWDDRWSGFWVRVAQQWDDQPQEFKQAIPERYRRTVGTLRRWEPWELDEAEDRTGVSKSERATGSSTSQSDENIETVDEAVLAEAIAEIESPEEREQR